jgi:hypothetical protein
MKRLCLLFALVLVTAGCTSVTVRTEPKFDLGSLHHLFVEQPFNENHHIDELIAEELRAAGRDASSGPMTMMPDNTDAVITYDSRWTWDFKSYLIELDITVHTIRGHKIVASGRYYQPSIRTQPPEVLVHELVTRLFAK